MNRLSLFVGITAVAAGWGMSSEASAVTRFYMSHGTANCQAALPVFDTNIRKRPQAVANEGTSTAFVTCDTESINKEAPAFLGVVVYFVNRSAAALTVNCTLVDGMFSVGIVAYPMTSASIAVNTIGSITWDAFAIKGSPFAAPATSCALPPGVEIAATEFAYIE